MSVVSIKKTEGNDYASIQASVQKAIADCGGLSDIVKPGYKVLILSLIHIQMCIRDSYKADGLDIRDLEAYIANSSSHSLEGYSAEGVKKIDNDGLLCCDCDVLIPCALENQITADNADRCV